MKLNKSALFGVSVAAVFGLQSAFAVETAVSLEDNAVEIERDASDLSDRVRHPDVDIFDTAIVASNSSAGQAVVVCAAFNHNGKVLDKARMRVPGAGLRFLLASDIANGRDFAGRVQCVTGNEAVTPSAYLLGPEFEQLPSDSVSINGIEVLDFPVVLTQ